MEIIPVIDLLGGLVVHAVKGQRAHYQPIKSRLCSGCAAPDVAEALLGYTGAGRLYIADLDALMGKAPQTELIDALQTRLSGIEFWLDNGYSLPAQRRRGIPVAGSESLDRAGWAELQSRAASDWILSLDFFEGALQGCADIIAQPERWPERVIVMCLDQVGSFDGPDWPRLEIMRRLAPAHCRIIAAGGVRNRADVLRLDELGVSAVLAASALHAGISLR